MYNTQYKFILNIANSEGCENEKSSRAKRSEFRQRMHGEPSLTDRKVEDKKTRVTRISNDTKSSECALVMDFTECFDVFI